MNNFVIGDFDKHSRGVLCAFDLVACTFLLEQVVKLHTKLGKPIPSSKPVLVTTCTTATVMLTKTVNSSVTSTVVSAASKSSSSGSIMKKAVPAISKVTFIGKCRAVLNMT